MNNEIIMQLYQHAKVTPSCPAVASPCLLLKQQNGYLLYTVVLQFLPNCTLHTVISCMHAVLERWSHTIGIL